MWKVDLKDKCTYKFKYDPIHTHKHTHTHTHIPTHIYRENMIALVGVSEGTMGRLKMERISQCEKLKQKHTASVCKVNMNCIVDC
jgi:hypothetical protein